jgi:hypothetical protein
MESGGVGISWLIEIKQLIEDSHTLETPKNGELGEMVELAQRTRSGNTFPTLYRRVETFLGNFVP